MRTLKNFDSEKSGKRCEKSGKHWIKPGNREILRRFIFFPVSAPGSHELLLGNVLVLNILNVSSVRDLTFTKKAY